MSSLSDLVDHVRGGRSFETELGDFLDRFYAAPVDAMIRKKPALLGEAHPQGAIIDAFLGAVAEYLGRRHGLHIPPWAYEQGRYLQRPFFALEALAFRATLLLESPAEFRSRNLFVTANALSRASQYASSNASGSAAPRTAPAASPPSVARGQG